MGIANGRVGRQRRERRGARQRILDAASALLEEHRWHELRLEDLMSAAGLTRTAFYRHFDDRHALLMAMLGQVNNGVGSAGSAWKQGTGEAVDDLRAGLAELAEAMRRHGRLMQAVADSAAQDPDTRAAHEQMIAAFSQVTAQRIRADVAAGHSAVRAPEEVATALVRMNESLLLAAYGHPPYPDRDSLVETMVEIWAATIYGRDALERADAEGQRST